MYNTSSGVKCEYAALFKQSIKSIVYHLAMMLTIQID